MTSLAEALEAADVSAFTTPEKRVAMVGELTRAAWALSGLPMPTYTRSEMPGRMVRPGEALEEQSVSDPLARGRGPVPPTGPQSPRRD